MKHSNKFSVPYLMLIGLVCAGCSSTLQEENKALVRRVMVEIPVNDWEAVRELHSPDFIYHGPDPTQTMTRKELGQMISMLVSAFPDFSRTIKDMIAEEDRVAIRTAFKGTHRGEFMGIPPTGKTVSSEGMVILRIADGKIVEAWEQYDDGSFQQQLGGGDVALASTANPESDEWELVRLQQEWCRAEMERDAVALGHILADEYVLVISDGTILPRAELLREVETGEVPFTAIAVEGTRVRLYGNMAVVKGVVKWSDAGGTKHQSLFTETWQRRDGRWQCLATHESGEHEIVAPEKAPGYQKMKRLSGDWTYEGHVDPQWKDTAYGPAGKFTGEFQARFILNGQFVEEQWEQKNESGGALRGITIYRYDADTGNIISNGFLSDGSRDNTVYTMDGDSLVGNLRQTGADGKESLVKAVWKYGPNHDTFTSTWDLSLDEGKTWKRWLTYEAKKVNK